MKHMLWDLYYFFKDLFIILREKERGRMQKEGQKDETETQADSC